VKYLGKTTLVFFSLNFIFSSNTKKRYNTFMAEQLRRLDSSRLIRPKKGRKVAGVALAFANYFNWDVTLVRLIWLILLIPGGVPGLLPYIICWLVIPEE
jgi:phage shock protein C